MNDCCISSHNELTFSHTLWANAGFSLQMDLKPRTSAPQLPGETEHVHAVKGVKGYTLDDSQHHEMVGWEVGEQYTLRFQIMEQLMTSRQAEVTGHTFPSPRRASPLGEANAGDGPAASVIVT